MTSRLTPIPAFPENKIAKTHCVQLGDTGTASEDEILRFLKNKNHVSGLAFLPWQLYLMKALNLSLVSDCLLKDRAMNTDSLFDLTPPEKLQLVEDLWDDLAAKPDDVPVHEWQKEELARRKANLMRQPASGISWEELKTRIRSRHGR